METEIIVAIVVLSLFLVVAIVMGFLAYFAPAKKPINNIIDGNETVVSNANKLSANPYADIAVKSIQSLQESKTVTAEGTRVLDLTTFDIYVVSEEGEYIKEENKLNPLVPIFVTTEGTFYIEDEYLVTQKPSPVRVDINSTLTYGEEDKKLGLSSFNAQEGDVLTWNGKQWQAFGPPGSGLLIHSFSAYALQPRIQGFSQNVLTSFTVSQLVGEVIILLTMHAVTVPVDCVLLLIDKDTGKNLLVKAISNVATTQTVFMINDRLNIENETVVDVAISLNVSPSLILDYFSISKKVDTAIPEPPQKYSTVSRNVKKK